MRILLYSCVSNEGAAALAAPPPLTSPNLLSEAPPRAACSPGSITLPARLPACQPAECTFFSAACYARMPAWRGASLAGDETLYICYYLVAGPPAVSTPYPPRFLRPDSHVARAPLPCTPPAPPPSPLHGHLTRRPAGLLASVAAHAGAACPLRHSQDPIQCQRVRRKRPTWAL